MREFTDIISHGFTNGEVDQMEQDATDAHVAYQVERIVQRVRAAGVAREVVNRKRFGRK